MSIKAYVFSIFSLLIFVHCSFNVNAPEKENLKLADNATYKCMDRANEGGQQQGDSLLFEVHGDRISGVYFAPNSINLQKTTEQLSFYGVYNLSPYDFKIKAEFEVASNLQIQDTSIIGAYYYQDSAIYEGLRERWSSSDTLHFEGDTLIRVHSQKVEDIDSTLTEIVSDTLVLTEPIIWKADTNISLRDSTFIEIRLDSISYDLKGDPDSEFRLREFYFEGWEQIGYWIDCKIQ